jgi:ankyrin repeat protein
LRKREISIGKLKLISVRKFVHDDDMAMWFLGHGAEPDARCYLDLTPLSLAVRYASVSTFQVLLNRGSADKGQLVHHAVEREVDTIEVLDILVDKGAPLDELQYERDLPSWNHEFFKGLGTPLHRATELGKIDVARYLLQNHANRNARDSNGCTPLDIAYRKGFQDLIQLLKFL